MSLLKQNSIYGATVAHRTVFTREGALERYRAILEVCYNPLTPAGAIVIFDCQSDLIKIGFTLEEVEQIEFDYLKEVAQ